MLDLLPVDWRAATLVGRADLGEGPTPILVRRGEVFDVSAIVPTVSALMDAWPLAEGAGRSLGRIDELAFDIAAVLLAPIDLQCVKAAGVTFAVSAVERVIEERARGDAGRALAIREALKERVGADIRAVQPGSPAAARLKKALIADGLWSQYLEVAIGPDAEIFTKAPVLSAVGAGAEVGVRSDSDWNNPEPEIVLVCDGAGRAVGASLGNDVNLRDFEGRSALLLGKAKDNNASCAIGPFVRLFDEGFTLDDVRQAEVALRIDGPEGYRLEGVSSMAQISRDPLELVRQALSEHQYPDGFALFLGTLFAPTQDRDTPGRGFTHKVGDVVRVSTPKLGALQNRVTTSKAAPPWTLGIGQLMGNLARRGLLPAPGDL
ncbi:fumarylacetoacetate hydrolase family protein [Phenylobacterium montanum]|uniref:Fumarylacetoacetate hydrolase family protein n=1 Tax=Phenylobacterium montanum TaxID=2823693 RepID=A0A975IWC9_9CAUL|nr:fumarylacetoacetate hydrolase family protein [Caulobacter sp. S6]QUD88261.1 fumarylacetoacetate hydrolase family protein [Caulobacter sp. S6]